MKAGEKLKAKDGKEVMLFPLPYMYITQGEGESFSHAGTYNIDFVGYGANGVIEKAPIYAPCSCKCVATIDASANGRVFQSLDRVHTPDGLQYINFLFLHDETPIANIGDKFNQGDLIAHTGIAGYVTGDHTHFNTAIGKYAGWEHVPPDNNGQLINSTHVYDICYVNDTVLVNDYNYNWITYSGGVSPSRYKKSKFPWVLYARNLRDKRY